MKSASTLKYLILSAFILIQTGVFAKTPSLYRNADQKEMKAWVDSVYSQLSRRERIGQLFMPIVMAKDSLIDGNLRKLVQKDGVGGILFSRGYVSDYVHAVNYSQELSKVPLMISIDGEWGVSMRVKDAVKFPRNMVIGAISDDKLIYAYGCELARQCKLLGIHVDFAPVLDVNTNPENPIIGTRALGELHHKVAQKGVALSKGMEDSGILSVGKHFPGHGSTTEDSHKTLPTIDKQLKEYEMIDLYPFRKYINSGLGGILTAHLNLPQFDDSGKPGSMNKTIVKEYLQDKLGFEGLTFTDGLNMKGAIADGSVCVAALKAGNDVLLAPKNISGEIKEIEQAIDNGTLEEALVNAKCRKILEYKYVLNAHQPATLEEDGLKEKLNSTECMDLLAKLRAASITVFKNSGKVLPVHGEENIVVMSPTGVRADFLNECKKYAKVRIAASASTVARTVIVPVISNNAYCVNYLKRIADTGKNVVAVFFMNPYEIGSFAESLAKPNVSAVMAYDNVSLAHVYAAKAIFGAIKVDAKIPVTIPGVVKAGTGCKYPAIVKN